MSKLFEVKFGEILGTGAFGVVREVKIIELADASEADPKALTNVRVKSKSDLMSMYAEGRQDSEKSFSSAASRDLMSAICVRHGESRYAVKYLMLEDFTEDQQARARVDLAIEVNYLKALSHPHIVKIRGVLKTENPFHPIFFLSDG
jgi:serine/threonine protein kinase